MSIDSELRRLGTWTREAVVSGIDVEARLDELKATSRRRRGGRVVAGLVAAAAAVVAVAGLVPLGASRDPAPVVPDLERRSVTCGEALGGNVAPEGAVQCLAPRLALVRGPVDYTFRIPLGVPWMIGPWGAPATLRAGFDRADASAEIGVFADVRAAAGEDGRELPAAQLASWVATRPFLDSTPIVTGRLDGLRTWTVEVRARTGLARPGPGRACNGVDTDCHALLMWRQGSSVNEDGAWDGDVARWTFLDVPGRGVVALGAWAGQRDEELLDEGTALLRTVDFLLPGD